MNFLDTLKNMRNRTDYEYDPVSDEKIETILKAGLLTNYIGVVNSCEFIVVRDEHSMTRLVECLGFDWDDPYSREKIEMFQYDCASAAIVIVSPVNEQRYEDAISALSNMRIMAEMVGVGTDSVEKYWFEDELSGERIASLLDISEDYEVETILLLGGPGNLVESPPKFDKESVHWETFLLNDNRKIKKTEIDQKIDKIRTYRDLGGEKRLLKNLDGIEESIEKLEYLQSVQAVKRQGEFLDCSVEMVKRTIANEEKDFKTLNEILGKDIDFLQKDRAFLEEFMGDRYEDFEEYAKNYGENPLNGYCGMLETMLEALNYRAGGYALGVNENYDRVLEPEYFYIMAELTKKFLKPLLQYESPKSRKGKNLYLSALLVQAQCYMLKGQMAKAVRIYEKILSREDVKKESVFAADVITNIYAILRILGLEQQIDDYAKKYGDLLENAVRKLSDTKNSIPFMSEEEREAMAQVIENQNKEKTISLVWIATAFYFGEPDSALYRAIIERNYFSPIGFLYYNTETESEKGTIDYSGKRFCGKGEVKVPLINHLPEIVERERKELW